MGSLNPENNPKQELDDSGYVQEEAPSSTKMVSASGKSAAMGKASANLLDLSDDVLLYILQYCSPSDLKALGFACGRLGTLVLDRSLWRRVDARGPSAGRDRVRWLLTHALGAHTTMLKLTGYAREATGSVSTDGGGVQMFLEPRQYSEPTRSLEGSTPVFGRNAVVTLTHSSLRRLTALCSSLTTLALEHVVIDCSMTNICMFPRSLRVLSLLGTKCFNAEKSFLYKIQDHLVNLEELDVSECDWVEPSCMLPLSKMPRLARLSMRLCAKLTEFVAYASLATRYGFKQLRAVDLRQSPVGDSEVSALGWLPLLEELYLSPAPPHVPRATHAHLTRDHRTTTTTTWEEQEPEYYKSKYETEEWIAEENSPPSRNWQQEIARPCVVLHHLNLLGGDDNQLPSSSTSDRANEIPIIISKNGVRRPPNLSPDAEVTEREANTKKSIENQTNGKQNQVRKRKPDKDDTSPTKRRKDDIENRNESNSSNVMKESSDNAPCFSNIASNDDSVNSEPASGEPTRPNEPVTSNESTFLNEPTSSKFLFSKSSNEQNSTGNKKNTQTKGSRKHYDPNYQVSRITLKYCLDDFKKRTEGVDMTDDSFDSDDDPSFDDDSPQSKRSRLNETASTSDSDSSCCENESKRSKKTNLKRIEKDSRNKPDISPEPNSSNSRDCEMKEHYPESSSRQSDTLLKQYRDDLSNQQLPRETEQNQQTPRFVTFRRDKPPIFMNEPAVRSSNQVVIDGCYPQVVVGERPAMEGCNMPPVVVVSGDNQPSVVVRCGENHVPVTSCNHSQQSVGNQLGNGNQPAVVIGCGNQSSAMGCSHNQQSATSGGDNQPAIVVGCGNQAPVSCSHNQASVVVGCSHNQPAIVVGCSHNQPPVSGENRPAVMVGCSHHDDNQNIHNNNDVQQPDWNNRLNMQGLNLDGQRQETSGTTQSSLDDNASTHNAVPSQSNASPSQANAAPSQANAAPSQGNAAPSQGNAVPNAAPENAENDVCRHRMLYINIGRRRHTMYQISMPDPVDMVEYRVTDSAIYRFGRADSENINYVHIGPLEIAPGTQERPNRSNLRILSVTGFRQITNNSLTHLATAAPYLQSVDFTGTRVTETGVEHFRNFRPECRVRYGPIDTPKEVCGRPLSR